MKQKLQTRLLNYFMLIAFAAMLIGVEFYFEMSRAEVSAEICTIASEVEAGISEALPLDGMRNKIVIMFGVLTMVVAIVLTMFIRNITTPLQKMADVAAQINEGNLSLTVPIETHDEIGQVGEAINELTSNLQEVATMTCTTATDTLNQIEQVLAAAREGQEVSAASANDVRAGLQSLIEFVDSFTLLKTDIA